MFCHENVERVEEKTKKKPYLGPNSSSLLLIGSQGKMGGISLIKANPAGGCEADKWQQH